MTGVRIDQTRDGAVLTVRVQPRAKREGVVGLHGDALKVALRAPPVDGAANQALLVLLGEVCGVPPSSLVIVQGQTGRSKRVAFTTLDAETLRARLAAAKERG